MGKKRQQKEPVVPKQDKRICGGICLCQFTIVTSCVALVYLAVAVYMPSYRAFTYGLEPVPVMCQSTNASMVNNCMWTSCGEWCLTKSSGLCSQIHVTVRRNGTTMSLEDCNEVEMISCPMPSISQARRYNCNNDRNCSSLTGVFNCSLGHCTNISGHFMCHNRADGITVDADKDNLKLNGFFECHKSRCTKYTKRLNCDRLCDSINTTSKNVYIQQSDNLYTAICHRAIAHDAANGNEQGIKIDPPQEIWREEPHGGLLITSCHTVQIYNGTIKGTDCLNGTLVNDTTMLQSSINFTTFWTIVESSTKLLDNSFRFLPPQNHLTIYNNSRLYINLEGCVNTLKSECAEFTKTHGNDGDNKTAQSRFPCFYHKNDSFMVVTRFNLEKTWMELMIAIFVPSSLFIISFITLLAIGHSVQVGDDTKMRCVLCRKKKVKTQEEVEAEIDLVMEGIIEQTNAMCISPTGEDTST